MHPVPVWARGAMTACSCIRRGDDPVEVYVAPEDPSRDDDGRLSVRLLPGKSGVRAVDAAGEELGCIRSEGFPGSRYVMRRGTECVWTLSVRSIIRTQHRLTFPNGDTWAFETPLFLRMNVKGTVDGAPRLLGQYQGTKLVWALWVEPGRDTPELLSAVGFMHRQWYRW